LADVTENFFNIVLIGTGGGASGWLYRGFKEGVPEFKNK